MPYNILIFSTRKPELSSAEFKDRYEGHIRLLKFYAGDLFPKRHRRYYLHSGVDDHPAVLRGNKAFFNFDAVAEVGFDDEAAHHAFIESLSTEEASAKVFADELGFSDPEKLALVVIGSIQETKT
jgi:hypothetical protein